MHCQPLTREVKGMRWWGLQKVGTVRMWVLHASWPTFSRATRVNHEEGPYVIVPGERAHLEAKVIVTFQVDVMETRAAVIEPFASGSGSRPQVKGTDSAGKKPATSWNLGTSSLCPGCGGPCIFLNSLLLSTTHRGCWYVTLIRKPY